MTAANSFIAGSTQAITSYPPEQRVVPAAVIDMRAACAANADYELTKQDVLDWEAENGKLAPETFFIMFTGWQDRWNDPKAFFNIDAKGNLHYPGFAKATTLWLVQDRQIAGVGIDTHAGVPQLIAHLGHVRATNPCSQPFGLVRNAGSHRYTFC